MKKDCKVKAHRRKGKMVKSHSRSIKTSMKPEAGAMTKEECKAKYDSMVAKFGADSTQAKKLAMKMENMESVEKEYKTKKHSRGSYMRKGIEEDVLTKEARKKKHARTTKNKKGVWESGDDNMGALSAPAAKSQLKARNRKSKLKSNTLMGRINLRGGIEAANRDNWDTFGKQHPLPGNGNKSKRRLGVAVKNTRPKKKK